MHESRFEGIVIGHENWGDADRLISFYTPHNGKVEAVARGVRHEKSKLRGHLELLTHGEFMIAKNHGRGVLIDAMSHKTFSALRTHTEIAYLGEGVANMYDTYLYPHAVDVALWELLFTTLEELAGAREAVHADFHDILERFARRFLKCLGYLADSCKKSSLQTYDGLLLHTDILGPQFVAMAKGLKHLAAPVPSD
ncbi:MAG: DNA repair protein RecO [bacterium]|nr:DNA repair protein RecO [bacterium]